jgi:hypothetical protein
MPELLVVVVAVVVVIGMEMVENTIPQFLGSWPSPVTSISLSSYLDLDLEASHPPRSCLQRSSVGLAFPILVGNACIPLAAARVVELTPVPRGFHDC